MSNHVENFRKQITITKGMSIYDVAQVAGVNHYAVDALSFSNRKYQYLEFVREPKNKYDANAIKVIGCSKGLLFFKRRIIGYVPKEIAKKIVDLGIFSQVIPRLERIFVDLKGHIDIGFQVLGPRKGEKEYKQQINE